MQPFFTIDETTITPTVSPAKRDGYRLREAARAVVVDPKGKVALLRVASGNYHKLPGGGIDPEEAVADALARELKEEIGCTAEVIENLGTVQEHRYFCNMNQLSYCFLARQTGRKGAPDFTAQERAEGFEIVWADTIDHAIELLEGSQHTADPAALNVTFMRIRDVAIAKKAKISL
jgi:ADP-ribose pyrophosphatase YjhB (NUDIX family)